MTSRNSTLDKITGDDSLVLSGIAAGLTNQQIASRCEWSVAKVDRRRASLDRVFGEPTLAHLIVRLMTDGLWDMFNPWPTSAGDNGHRLIDNFRDLGEAAYLVRDALRAQRLPEEDLKYLIAQCVGYPKVEFAWRGSQSDAAVGRILAHAGLDRRTVKGPYMLVLAVTAHLGHITRADLPSEPEEPNFTRAVTLPSGQVILVWGPKDIVMTLTVQGQAYEIPAAP